VAVERPSFIQATVQGRNESVVLEWARDSAFRFFPLVEHPDFGLTLHPFDLATNKVLALVGRLEVRDWIDVLQRDVRLQPLGYLAYAACGKDPGFTPGGILDHAARARYSAVEVAALVFGGAAPDAADLSRRWRRALALGRETVDALPAEAAGHCVLWRGGGLFRGELAELASALSAKEIRFHPGSIRGALPRLVD
jgi:hypothetical protein